MFKESLFREGLRAYAGDYILNQIETKGKAFLVPSGHKQDLVVCNHSLAGHVQVSDFLGPQEFMDMMNDFATLSVDVVESHGGTVIDFDGSELLSVWGLSGAAEMTKVIQAIEAIQRESASLSRGIEAVRVHSGIAVGPCLVGNVGGKNRLKFAVVGSVPILAKNLADCNYLYDSKTILSQEARDAVLPECNVRELDTIRVKGRIDPMRIFQLL